LSSFYQHSKETPIYGNGQGAGDSPSQWCQQSAILFELYAELNKGAKMTSPDGTMAVKSPLAAFADDTNLLGNDDDNNKTIDDLIKEAQMAFTTWNELLHAMGHFMEMEKCACYLSVWDFQEDGYAYTREPNILNQKLIIVDKEGKEKTIRQLSTTESQKLLGVMKNPMGNQQDEIRRLQEKSAKMARNLNSHALSRTEAKLAYDAFYIPTMRYSLAVTAINQIDLETVQQKITSSLLAFLGYNRHMPREVIFGAKKFQGLGLRHLYDIQGVDGTRLLLHELNNGPSTTNKMLQITLDVIQQEAGIYRPILEETRPLQYIEWGWIPSVRDFLHHIDARIMNATQGLQVYRENDCLIMDNDYISRATRKEAILINRCRLALQVECLSDIATADGRQIDRAWTDLSTAKPLTSTKRWPQQENPGTEAWSIWQKFLNKAFLKNNSMDLRIPLGHWRILNPTRKYKTYYCPKKGTLWKRLSTDSWSQHRQMAKQRRHYIFEANGKTISNVEPSDIFPLDILSETTNTIITGRLSEHAPKPTDQSTAETLTKKMRKLQDSNILFQGTKLLISEDRLLDRPHPIFVDIAPDGSHDFDRGIITYGWVVAINEEIIAEGCGPAEGHPSLVESFRAEAYGLASAAAFIKLMIDHTQADAGKFKWFCHIDNKALIKRMENYQTEQRSAKWLDLPDFDITDMAVTNLQGIPVQYEHVKSHQMTAKEQKRFPSMLNDKADKLAKQQQRFIRYPRSEVSIPYKHLVIKDMVVTKDLQQLLMEAASKIPLQQYYKEKYKWSTRTFGEIHWDVQHKVLIGYDINDQRRLLKFMHNWLPTNKRLHREKSSPTQRCPLCFYIVEDELHLFTCHHPTQKEVITSLQSRIRQEINVQDEIKDLLISFFTAGIHDGNWIPRMPQEYPPAVRKGIEAQTRIGWPHVIYGRLARDLVTSMAATDSGSTRASSDMHARKLIRAIWDSFLKLWRQRNAAVHGVTEATRKTAQSQALEMRVLHCYEQQYIMPIDDRQRLFQKSKEEKLNEDPRSIKTWLRMADKIIRTNKRENKQRTGQRRMMDQYFKWNPPDPRKPCNATDLKQHRKQDLKPD
jgi:hypothetical protein